MMTDSYTHSSHEAQEPAAEPVAGYSEAEMNGKYVKTRKAGPRGRPPVRRKLLKIKVAGGRLELPTLGL
jgi:hypothetical protein